LEITLIDGITLGIALFGVALGALNTWQEYHRDRVRLRVVPKVALPIGPVLGGSPTLCIDITNLSSFPVTISEVGLRYRGSKKRGTLTSPILFDQGGFPRRLEPRSTFTVFFHPSSLVDGTLQNARTAYAETDCGEIVEGSSLILDKLVRGEPPSTLPPPPDASAPVGTGVIKIDR
jgi:hypothetical protein